jgi:hypothetical protein
MPEEALCAAVQDGRLPWMMISGELRHELARGDFYIDRPIGAALPSPFGPDCFVGGSSEPRLTRWRRLDVAPWELHDATYRFVVSKAGLERQLTPAPAEMSVLRQVQRSPAVAPAAAPPRQRRAKRGTPRELCKLLIPEAIRKPSRRASPTRKLSAKSARSWKSGGGAGRT